jgi:hypothetical protein
MRKGTLLMVAVPALLMTAALAQAQLPINSPAAHWGPMTTDNAAPAYTAPSAAATGDPNSTVVIEQPGTAVPGPSAPVVAPPPGAGAPAVMLPDGSQTTAIAPEGSTVVVLYNGVRQRVKTYADNATVRSFDPARGILSLDDGTVLNFPSNFVFMSAPETGQPVTVYYFQDQAGNNVLSMIDMGKDAGSGGGDSGGGQ